MQEVQRRAAQSQHAAALQQHRHPTSYLSAHGFLMITTWLLLLQAHIHIPNRNRKQSDKENMTSGKQNFSRDL